MSKHTLALVALVEAAVSAQQPPVAVSNSPAPVIALPPPIPPVLEPVPPPLIVMPPPPSATIVRPPQPRAPAQSYVSADDYPPSARAAKAEGRTVMRVHVGANGRVHGCRIEQSSGSAVLDGASCAIVQRRARYSPAVDSNGNLAAAAVIEIIDWRLP